MTIQRAEVLETRAFIKKKFNEDIPIGIMTGTGLSESPGGIDPVCCFDYSDLPHFPVSTTDSHKGKLLIGQMMNKNILVMQGRCHLYEGYTPYQVSYPIRVMQELGVSTLIVNNAAGGINLEYNAGDLMIIKDHINLTGQNPLVGPNQSDWGIRFPDMTRVYDPNLTKIALDVAKKINMPIHQGIYAGLLGPSLETPSEIRFLKTIGCDAVGMSTIMEVIAAVHAKMNIIGLSLITNINDPDKPVQTTLEAVLDTARSSIPRMNQLITGIIEKIEG